MTDCIAACLTMSLHTWPQSKKGRGFKIGVFPTTLEGQIIWDTLHFYHCAGHTSGQPLVTKYLRQRNLQAAQRSWFPCCTNWFPWLRFSHSICPLNTSSKRQSNVFVRAQQSHTFPWMLKLLFLGALMFWKLCLYWGAAIQGEWGAGVAINMKKGSKLDLYSRKSNDMLA